MCVTQRVKNKIAFVRVKSSGWNTIALACTNSRVWSSAMMIITMPRKASIDVSRYFAPSAVLIERILQNCYGEPHKF